MDDDKTGKRCVGTPVPGCPQIPSRREAHLHYLRKTNPNTQKQEAHHNRFHGKDVLPSQIIAGFVHKKAAFFP